MNLRPRPREEPELNLTSLIDIVLLLLVFFMVSTTFVDEARIKIRLPQSGAAPSMANTRAPVEVTVTAEGGYRVNGRTVINSSTQALSAAISEVAGDRHEAPVTIRADGRSSHQAVVTAMDVLGRLGFRTINIATVNQTPTPESGKNR